MKNSDKRYIFIIISTIFILNILFISCASKSIRIQMTDGKLRPCPESPNCVSSETGDEFSRIKPLTFQGSPENAWKVLQESIASMGGNIQEEREGYLRAIFTSMVFKFEDDLECRMVSTEGIIHIRSGARTGYSDFRVNARRVENLRTIFNNKMKDGL
ncbi:MAG: DUF1499 domain-containing protein [Pseudomonadota bacterium]